MFKMLAVVLLFLSLVCCEREVGSRQPQIDQVRIDSAIEGLRIGRGRLLGNPRFSDYLQQHDRAISYLLDTPDSEVENPQIMLALLLVETKRAQIVLHWIADQPEATAVRLASNSSEMILPMTQLNLDGNKVDASQTALFYADPIIRDDGPNYASLQLILSDEDDKSSVMLALLDADGNVIDEAQPAIVVFEE